MSLLMMSVVIAGCESIDSNIESSDDDTIVVETGGEQIRAEQTGGEQSKLVKKSGCGMSPPIQNKQKIQDMLIKSGKIDVNASKEQIAHQVKQYIVNKRLAFAKKCRS